MDKVKSVGEMMKEIRGDKRKRAITLENAERVADEIRRRYRGNENKEEQKYDDREEER